MNGRESGWSVLATWMAFARTWPIRLLLRLFGLCPVVDLGEGGHGYDIEEWWQSRVLCSVDG